MNEKKERVERRFRRLLGMSDVDRERQNAILSKKADWWGVCNKCGVRLTGTPGDIARHRCI